MSETNENRHLGKVSGSEKTVIPESPAIDAIKGFNAIYPTLQHELGGLSRFPTNENAEMIEDGPVPPVEYKRRIKAMQKRLTPAKIALLNAYLESYKKAKEADSIAAYMAINAYVDTLKPSCKNRFVHTMLTMDELLDLPEAVRFTLENIAPESCKRLKDAADQTLSEMQKKKAMKKKGHGIAE